MTRNRGPAACGLLLALSMPGCGGKSAASGAAEGGSSGASSGGAASGSGGGSGSGSSSGGSATGSSGGGSASGSSGGASSSGVVDAGALGNCSVPCPVSEPTVGDSCDFMAACEYGGSPFAQCNRVYDCISAHVAVVPGFTLDASACPLGLFPDCPASRAMIVPGESCGMMNGLQCVYVDGECDCLPGDGTSPTWECSGADASISQGCPVPRAMLGTPCSSASEFCQQIATGGFEVCSSCGNSWGVEIVPDGNSATPLLSDRD
jgi:hypothetical protein